MLQGWLDYLKEALAPGQIDNLPMVTIIILLLSTVCRELSCASFSHPVMSMGLFVLLILFFK